jgi:futalosine hydrolase
MGKNILVIAATAKEINPFIELTRTGDLKNNIDILISGIGLAASTYHLAKQLALKKYDVVIQAGVAGSFDLRIAPRCSCCCKAGYNCRSKCS